MLKPLIISSLLITLHAAASRAQNVRAVAAPAGIAFSVPAVFESAHPLGAATMGMAASLQLAVPVLAASPNAVLPAVAAPKGASLREMTTSLTPQLEAAAKLDGGSVDAALAGRAIDAIMRGEVSSHGSGVAVSGSGASAASRGAAALPKAARIDGPASRERARVKVAGPSAHVVHDGGGFSAIAAAAILTTTAGAYYFIARAFIEWVQMAEQALR